VKIHRTCGAVIGSGSGRDRCKVLRTELIKRIGLAGLASGHYGPAMAARRGGGHARTVTGEPAVRGRPGWVRDVAVPRDLGELRGPLTGRVRLPLRLYWSGPAPEQVEWDLSRESRRARLYELVLREGTLADIRRLVDGIELVRLWDGLWLPPHVRVAWQPLIDATRNAA
jgi:hypothetical protein